jgi:hypothetical protein
VQIVSGRNWKRRYFILMSDGQLLYKNDKDEPVKNTVQLTSKSKAMVLKELMSEGGIYVEGPTHDPLYLKAESTKEAKEWIKCVNDLIKQLAVNEAKQRNNTLEVFAKANKTKDSAMGKSMRTLGSLGSGASSRTLGSSTRAGAKEKRTPPPPEGGWVMRIGDGKVAKDVFVDANTWMYYADKASFDKNGKVIGKAELASLV